jgi:chloramphenicol 3-O phosphotransferase
MIIFLNGCSSSGKTTIATAIQLKSDHPWLSFGVDMYMAMLPRAYTGFGGHAHEGIEFIRPANAHQPTINMQYGTFGQQFNNAVPDVLNALANHHLNCVFDEVLLDDSRLPLFARTLKNHTVYLIGVTCDLEILIEREMLRGDRALGLVRGQYNKVHSAIKAYDLMVDTSRTTAFENTQTILDFIAANPHPQALSFYR